MVPVFLFSNKNTGDCVAFFDNFVAKNEMTHPLKKGYREKIFPVSLSSVKDIIGLFFFQLFYFLCRGLG